MFSGFLQQSSHDKFESPIFRILCVQTILANGGIKQVLDMIKSKHRQNRG